jgi:hypothetical protein
MAETKIIPLQMISPEALVRAMGVERVIQAISPEDLVRVCGPEVLARVYGPEAFIRAYGPERIRELLDQIDTPAKPTGKKGSRRR